MTSTRGGESDVGLEAQTLLAAWHKSMVKPSKHLEDLRESARVLQSSLSLFQRLRGTALEETALEALQKNVRVFRELGRMSGVKTRP